MITLDQQEVKALMAYIETLEAPFGLDMMRKWGLGLAGSTDNNQALLLQSLLSVRNILAKLEEETKTKYTAPIISKELKVKKFNPPVC